MSQPQWYVRDQSAGKTYGPYTANDVLRGVAQGQIGRNWLIARQGWSEWRSVAEAYDNGWLNEPEEPQSPPLTGTTDSNAAPDIETPSVTIQAKARSFGRARTQEFSWWYLLDWKFEHYLTPWLIRISWLSAVAFALLAIVGTGVEAIGRLLPDTALQTEFRLPSPSTTKPAPPGALTEIASAIARGVAKVVDATGYMIVKTIVIIIVLIYLRVAAETLIIIFNIADELTEIKNRLSNR